MGGQALRDNALADLSADSVLVLRTLDALESWNVPVGPVRELVHDLGAVAPP